MKDRSEAAEMAARSAMKRSGMENSLEGPRDDPKPSVPVVETPRGWMRTPTRQIDASRSCEEDDG
jgi:hypothetical protein